MTVRQAALRALAQRRLTEAQLWLRLERKGFPSEAISAAVASCKRDGYLDDRLYAELFVHGRGGGDKPVGDARLVATLVQRGIDREIAVASVEGAPSTQAQRCRAALDALLRRRPEMGYPSAARALERRAFPASVIYSVLRERIGTT